VLVGRRSAQAGKQERGRECGGWGGVGSWWNARLSFRKDATVTVRVTVVFMNEGMGREEHLMVKRQHLNFVLIVLL